MPGRQENFWLGVGRWRVWHNHRMPFNSHDPGKFASGKRARRFGNFGIESLLNDAGSRGNFFQGDGIDPRILFASGYFIVIMIVAVVLILFSMIWAISFAFAIPIAMENEALSPVEALKLSARASWGNVGGIIVLAILSFLIALGGVFALCIGVLFVLPIIWVSWAFAYRQVFPDLSPTVIRNEPPPPDAYRGSFGQGL